MPNLQWRNHPAAEASLLEITDEHKASLRPGQNTKWLKVIAVRFQAENRDFCKGHDAKELTHKIKTKYTYLVGRRAITKTAEARDQAKKDKKATIRDLRLRNKQLENEAARHARAHVLEVAELNRRIIDLEKTIVSQTQDKYLEKDRFYDCHDADLN